MSSNSLRERLERGESLHGLWVTLESATVTEVAAMLGFDWVAIDTEHGSLGPRDVVDHLRAASGSDLSVLVRVPLLDEQWIKRALDLGADGILVPLVKGADDVREALRLALYPPHGQRTLGAERAVGWGLRQAEYLARANRELLVVPIIETREAIEAIDDILAIDRLVAIFFGPGDLSASLGHLGQWEGPGVRERILEAVRRADARGVASGLIARDLEDARARIEEGFRLLAVGPDIRLLIDQADHLKKGLDAMSQGARP